MDRIIPIARDLGISAVIAVLTANLINLPNLVYQIVIAILLLLLLFFILRSLDKASKRLEVLSILYCEVFIKQFLDSLERNTGIEQRGKVINGYKLFIILPKTRSELFTITQKIRRLESFSLKGDGFRSLLVYGKPVDNTLLVFDTPAAWISGIQMLVEAEKIKEKSVGRLLARMNADIRTYVRKNMGKDRDLIHFIGLAEFERFFT